MDLGGEVDEVGGASVIEEEVGEEESQDDSSHHVCMIHHSSDHGSSDHGLTDLGNAPPIFDFPCDEVIEIFFQLQNSFNVSFIIFTKYFFFHLVFWIYVVSV